MQQNGQTVIIDCGSGVSKAGLSGDKVPRSTFQTIVGRQGNNISVGKEVQAKNGVLKFSRPIEHGVVNNWVDFTEILGHIFQNELKVTPNQHPTLLTESVSNQQYNREKLTEIMFEKFQVPAYYLALQPVLSLHATGRNTGIVLDLGDGLTQVVPINEGQVIKDAISRNIFGGRDVTEYLRKLLNEMGLNFSASAETYTLRDIKEKVCYVALNCGAEMAAFQHSTQNNKTYELPDGQVINITNQRFRASETLFKPTIVGKQLPGIHQSFFNSINKCSAEIRKGLYQNIVLSGGNTQFPGMAQRLTAEIQAVASTTKINVVAHAQRKFLTWIGGQIFSSLSTFKDMWITRADYQETGATIVHRKCP